MIQIDFQIIQHEGKMRKTGNICAISLMKTLVE